MKAVVCEAFGGPEVLALREMPDPPPPGPGEVQVRIAARGVQYVDVLMLAGKYQFRPELPSSCRGTRLPARKSSPSATRAYLLQPWRLHDMSRHRLGAFAQAGNSRAEDCDPVPSTA